jgi:predicted MFS family arabinose efflux permease
LIDGTIKSLKSQVECDKMLVLVVLWGAFFLINFNVAMMIPLLPFIQQSVGLSTWQAGWILAAFPVTAMISNLLLGPWIDRLGRKRFIVLGTTACTVVFLLTAAARNASTLIVCRALVGVFMPMVGASVFAAIADYIPPEDRARVTGYVTTAAPVAFLLSMSLGMLLGGLLAWQAPLIVVACFAGALAISAAQLPPTSVSALANAPVTTQTYVARLRSLSGGRETQLVFLAYLSWSAAVFVFLGLYPTWIVQRGLIGHGPGSIGAMLFLGEVGGLFGALLAGRLANLFVHPLNLCAIAALVTAIVVFSVPLGHDRVVFQAAAYVSFAFGRDLLLALILGGSMLLIPASQRGSLNAVLNAIYQTGATAGALIGAWLYGMRSTFMLNASVSGCLFVICGFSIWLISSTAQRPLDSAIDVK